LEKGLLYFWLGKNSIIIYIGTGLQSWSSPIVREWVRYWIIWIIQFLLNFNSLDGGIFFPTLYHYLHSEFPML
jgi:hypothetical protein